MENHRLYISKSDIRSYNLTIFQSSLCSIYKHGQTKIPITLANNYVRRLGTALVLQHISESVECFVYEH